MSIHYKTISIAVLKLPLLRGYEWFSQHVSPSTNEIGSLSHFVFDAYRICETFEKLVRRYTNKT